MASIQRVLLQFRNAKRSGGLLVWMCCALAAYTYWNIGREAELQRQRTRETIHMLLGHKQTCRTMRESENEGSAPGELLRSQAPINCSFTEDQLVTYPKGVLTARRQGGSKHFPNCSISPFGFNIDSDFEPLYADSIDIKWNPTGHFIPNHPFEFFSIQCTSSSPPIRVVFRENFYKSFIIGEEEAGLKSSKSSTTSPSVVIIGLESISAPHFIASMIHTRRVLEKLDFTYFTGYTAISDDAYSNVISALTGKMAVDTLDFKSELPPRVDAFYDEWPLHYATFLVEDQPEAGIFNDRGQSNGFRERPVDYYFRPFWISTTWSISSKQSSPHCYKRRPRHRLQMDYVEDALAAHSGRRVFGLAWFRELSKEGPNAITRMDQDLARFIRRIGRRENTIIILMSVAGKAIETPSGSSGSTRPLLTIHIPPTLAATFPNRMSNLEENAVSRFTTPFDLHATLKDIAGGFAPIRSSPSNSTRGTSLFYRIPPERSCFDAGIPSTRCTCFIEMRVPNEEAADAAEALVAYINSVLRSHEEEQRRLAIPNSAEAEAVEKEAPPPESEFACAPVRLESLVEARARILPPSIDHPVRTLHFLLTIRTAPPHSATMEGVMARDDRLLRWLGTGEIRVRERFVNAEDTLLCTDDALVASICYCAKRRKAE